MFGRRTVDLGASSEPALPVPPSSLHYRRSDTVWCIEGTKTFLSLRITSVAIPLTIGPVLNDAYNSVYAHIQSTGDGLLPGGTFNFADHLMVLRIWNSNNHQITWGVLGNALWGLRHYMQEKDLWGSAVFQVWDGSNWVGSGMVGLKPEI